MAATDFVTESIAQAAFLAVATDVKTLATQMKNNASDLSALTTSAKTNLVAAINELDAAIDSLSGGGGATNLDGLSDVVITSPATGHLIRYNGTNFVNVLGSTYFASPADVTSAINAVINAAPGALDTLDELAAALGDDANFAATMTTALAGKQASDATLTALAGLTIASGKMIYGTGADAFALIDSTTYGRTLVNMADAAAVRTSINVANGATANTASVADLSAYYTAARA